MSESKKKSPFLTIFLTVFLDMLGIGIIIPVIPVLFFDIEGGFFNAAISQDTRAILYGFLIACFPLFQFFGAPMLGALSDRYGRKPILLISLAGTFIGYLLFGIALWIQHLPLLFISRMLPGFTGGNISVIMSAISDISTEENKAQNFGIVGMAFGLGFILGPTLGGVLADDNIVRWFNASTPFWFTAVLTFINILVIKFLFFETLKTRRSTPVNLFRGIQQVGLSFKEPKLRSVFTIVLLFSLGFTLFTQFFAVLLIDKFSFTESKIGLLFGWIGIWIALTQGLLIRFIGRKLGHRKTLLYSILILCFAIGSLLIPSQAFWFYIICPFIAIGQGLTSPNLTAVVSDQAGKEFQGEILGINQSMASLGALIPPMVAGYMYTINSNLPLISSSVVVFIAWITYLIYYERLEKKKIEHKSSVRI